MRFGETIQAEIPPIPERLRQLPVPKLFLQPVLENCIEHGMTGSADPARIRICFLLEGNRAAVAVENSGDGISPEWLEGLRQQLDSHSSDSQTTGLTNVHRRLKLYYGEYGGVELDASSLGGLKVVLKLGVIDT